MKYVKIKDKRVWSDDGIDDKNLYMALDGEVAGVQVSEAGDESWDSDSAEEERLEEEIVVEEESKGVEEVGDVTGEWLRGARQVAQEGVRKRWGD